MTPRPRVEVPVRITAIPETAPYSVTVTVAANGRNVRLPRGEIDFSPGHVLVPAWLYKRLKQYLVET